MYGDILTKSTDSTSTKPDVYQYQIDALNKYINNISEKIDQERYERIRLSRKIKYLIAMLVDKNIIGEELAELIINESDISESKIDWLMKELEGKY